MAEVEDVCAECCYDPVERSVRDEDKVVRSQEGRERWKSRNSSSCARNATMRRSIAQDSIRTQRNHTLPEHPIYQSLSTVIVVSSDLARRFRLRIANRRSWSVLETAYDAVHMEGNCRLRGTLAAAQAIWAAD